MAGAASPRGGADAGADAVPTGSRGLLDVDGGDGCAGAAAPAAGDVLMASPAASPRANDARDSVPAAPHEGLAQSELGVSGELLGMDTLGASGELLGGLDAVPAAGAGAEGDMDFAGAVRSAADAGLDEGQLASSPKRARID